MRLGTYTVSFSELVTGKYPNSSAITAMGGAALATLVWPPIEEGDNAPATVMLVLAPKRIPSCLANQRRLVVVAESGRLFMASFFFWACKWVVVQMLDKAADRVETLRGATKHGIIQPHTKDGTRKRAAIKVFFIIPTLFDRRHGPDCSSVIHKEYAQSNGRGFDWMMFCCGPGRPCTLHPCEPRSFFDRSICVSVVAHGGICSYSLGGRVVQRGNRRTRFIHDRDGSLITS